MMNNLYYPIKLFLTIDILLKKYGNEIKKNNNNILKK